MCAQKFLRVFALVVGFAIATVFNPSSLFAQTGESLTTVADAADIPLPSPGPKADFPSLPPETQGDLLMVHGSYAAALDAYQRGPLESPTMLNKIGLAYHHLFALDEARKYYEMAIRLNPRYAEALNNLAAVYHGEHNYKQAEKTYKQALKLAPDTALTYKNLGTTYLSDQKYKQGIQAYNKALALNPNIFGVNPTQRINDAGSRAQRVDVDYYLAKTFAIAGKDEQALLSLRRALSGGFNDRRRLMGDKDFARLRNTPEFQQLVEQMLPPQTARHTTG